jgi:urease accessory protein
VVEPGARLCVRSVAASLALPGASDAVSHSCWLLEVAGDLDLDTAPMVVAARAGHHSHTELHLDGAATVRIRERVQIGRSGENEGFWTGSLHAGIDGTPLLRHRVELGSGAVADDEITAPRAYVGELCFPGLDADDGGMILELAAGGCLSSWQGDELWHHARERAWR